MQVLRRYDGDGNKTLDIDEFAQLVANNPKERCVYNFEPPK